MMITENNAGVLSSLTSEQQPIVEADESARILVTAGPGTGKTHTLIARLAHLIAASDISPGNELLVLSFSRAAVYEVRRRLAAAGGDVRYVRVCTFDSFATQLLMEFESQSDLSRLDYDGRILRASALIRTIDDVRERMGSYRHIMVDEVQDLVAVRSDFVFTILAAVQCGFTLFGDPAQGIYTFQLRKASRMLGALAFYRDLRQRFSETLAEYKLTINHRAKSKPARSALWAGRELNKANPDYAEIKKRLDTIVSELPKLGKIEDAVKVLRRPDMSTAILCRSNGQALAVSRALWGAKLHHHLQRRATERVIPAWVAATFFGINQHKISRKVLLGRLENVPLPPGITPTVAWAILKRTEAAAGDSLDIMRFAERVRLGAIPDELIERQISDLVVSTVHRAKGMEFDRVIVVDPNSTLSLPCRGGSRQDAPRG